MDAEIVRGAKSNRVRIKATRGAPRKANPVQRVNPQRAASAEGYVIIGISMRTEVLRALDARVAAARCSRSEFLRRAVAAYMAP